MRLQRGRRAAASRAPSHSPSQYLLVVRHGRPGQPQRLSETLGQLKYTLKEFAEIDHLAMPPVCGIWRADSHEAVWTSRFLARTLTDADSVYQPIRGDVIEEPSNPACREVKAWLGPPSRGPYVMDTDPKAARREVDTFFNGQTGPAMLTLVGHEPALGWLLDGWTTAGQPPPLASAEIACLARRGATATWRLWWVLTPSDPAGIPALREKLNSKMTAVALLAGFALAVAVDTLLRADSIADHSWSSWTRALTAAAATMFSLAAILFVGALLAYDQLMMPPRFWSSRRPGSASRLRWPHHHPTDPMRSVTVWRPPSSAEWVLYQESMRIWRRFVHSALAALIGGTALVAAGAAMPPDRSDFAVLAATVVIGSAATIVALHRPVTGATD